VFVNDVFRSDDVIFVFVSLRGSRLSFMRALWRWSDQSQTTLLWVIMGWASLHFSGWEFLL